MDGGCWCSGKGRVSGAMDGTGTGIIVYYDDGDDDRISTPVNVGYARDL
jgi:hypothetical protein